MMEVTLHPEDYDVIRTYKRCVCKPADLLLISNEVSKSFQAVCSSLQLEEDLVEKINSQDIEKYEKIFSAFFMWRIKHNKRTWGELADQVSRDDELIQIIVSYLDKLEPTEEG